MLDRLPLMTTLDVALSTLASTARGWRGTRAARSASQPERYLRLFEYEGCPFCRLVREALTELDLDALIHPCPRGGIRWRPVAAAIGGREQFPLLVDDNTETVCYESRDIVDYLHARYGAGRNRRGVVADAFDQATSIAASALRHGAGTRAADAGVPPPARPLELYSFESSPYSRRVRELLCDLEIAYVLRNVGKAQIADYGPPWVRQAFFPDAPVVGRNRERLVAETGRLQAPCLIDLNTDAALFESDDIRHYLHTTYGRRAGRNAP